MVLLIACANASNLALARGASRARELGLRAALGAGRPVDSAAAHRERCDCRRGRSSWFRWRSGCRSRHRLFHHADSKAYEVRVDVTVLLFMASVSVLTGLLFGIMPAWRLSTGRPMDVLKEGGLDGRPATRARSTLVFVECALAVTLLVGAGLLMRSLPSFDP
jgi:hypothetical protein